MNSECPQCGEAGVSRLSGPSNGGDTKVCEECGHVLGSPIAGGNPAEGFEPDSSTITDSGSPWSGFSTVSDGTEANIARALAQVDSVTSAFFLASNPLYMNQYVVDEVVTLLLYNADREKAENAYEFITESEVVQLLSVDDPIFEGVRCFLEGNDKVSFTDYTIGVHAREKGIDYVLAYDGDFEYLGLNKVHR